MRSSCTSSSTTSLMRSRAVYDRGVTPRSRNIGANSAAQIVPFALASAASNFHCMSNTNISSYNSRNFMNSSLSKKLQPTNSTSTIWSFHFSSTCLWPSKVRACVSLLEAISQSSSSLKKTRRARCLSMWAAAICAGGGSKPPTLAAFGDAAFGDTVLFDDGLSLFDVGLAGGLAVLVALLCSSSWLFLSASSSSFRLCASSSS
mmetsp:Transcript_123483/g.308581  ORF Transcript_123483/g.308581 Transcript_123483/m.308581 type:complete len:204 (+) Transcript_123483:944-1555(+)